MAFLVYLTNKIASQRININAERVDQRMTRSPLIYDRANKYEPKGRDLKKMRNMFIITAFLAGNYDIDNNGSIEDVLTQKHYIEDKMKDNNWMGPGLNQKFFWTDRTYEGFIMKVDFTEVGGEQGQYEVIIEFQEVTV